MKPEKQQQARDLYFQTDKTQQEIADILDVNRRTIYLWMKNGKWEEMKIAIRQAPFMILQDIHNHITAVNDKIREREPGDRCPTMEEVEKLRKLLGMTNLINKRNSGAYMETFGELIKFATSRDRDFARKVALLVDDYVVGHFGDSKFDYNQNCSENVRRVKDNLEKIEEISEPIPDDNLQPTESSSLDTYVTPPSPFMERAGVRSGIFCDKNEIFSKPTEIPKNQAATASNQNSPDRKYPISVFLQNGTFSSQLQEIMKLPPEKRPSPFRDGNILWVNHIDDVDERYDNFGKLWGERKMGDTIRRYPDVDQAPKAWAKRSALSKKI